MIPQREPNQWSTHLLLSKAQSYTEEMLSFPQDDWRFALWSTLSLELLARAALSTFSPALLADTNNWDNLQYALNIQPTTPNFIPRSVDISEVLKRLEALIPDFTPELASSCRKHMAARNEELHSGSTPFVDAKVASWLPNYYQSCAILLTSMKDSLTRFLGVEHATVAEAMIAAAKDESAKSVRQSINAHKTVWGTLDSEEQGRLAIQSTNWATRQTGHRVECPACNCPAIIIGAPIAAPLKTITHDEITETQQYLPSKFECLACKLKISGLSQLSAAGLGETYNGTFTYDANEYYGSGDDYEDYEPDFNEP